MDEANARSTPVVIVGVVPNQPDRVVLEAVRFAERFDARLVCATVDPGRYAVQELPDGTILSFPFDPDLPEMGEIEFDQVIAHHLATLLENRGVRWETRVVTGEPARALAHLAEILDAAMIVVGTREPTMRGGVREFFSGSVAAHLAHRQRCPVVVIPLRPVGEATALPWDNEAPPIDG